MSLALGSEVKIAHAQKKFVGAASPIFSDLNLNIGPGEFTALLGPSGCGKSTLLRIIAGLDFADSGHVTSSAGQARGFVFQDSALIPWRNVLDNVALPLTLMGGAHSDASAQEQARAALSRVGLDQATGLFPNQISGGMKMRVSVARALVAKPSLLLLDEPFAALDENTRHRLQEDLRELWLSLRMTTVFVTHSVSEAVFVANRLIVLSSSPAEIVLDQLSDLPEKRTNALRTETAFINEMKPVYAAFTRGETR